MPARIFEINMNQINLNIERSKQINHLIPCLIRQANIPPVLSIHSTTFIAS